MPRPTLILTGVETEARALAGALGLPRLDRPFAAFGIAGTRLAAVGPGAWRLDERLSSLALGLSSPLVVSAGLCGGLDPELTWGDLVVPEAVLDGEGGRRPVGEPLPGHPARGTVVTVAHVVATPEAKARLHAETGALAADMESAPILAAAARRGWPALVVRGVGDDARQGLPAELLGAVDADGRVHRARALRALLSRPRLLGPALVLRRTSAAALAAVAEALRALLR